MDLDVRVVLKVFPRLTCLLPYATVTATFGEMLGMRVGTTPLDLKALTTAAEDCAEMPTGVHVVARFSTGVGAAKAAEALRRSERMVENCMFSMLETR